MDCIWLKLGKTFAHLFQIYGISVYTCIKMSFTQLENRSVLLCGHDFANLTFRALNQQIKQNYLKQRDLAPFSLYSKDHLCACMGKNMSYPSCSISCTRVIHVAIITLRHALSTHLRGTIKNINNCSRLRELYLQFIAFLLKSWFTQTVKGP